MECVCVAFCAPCRAAGDYVFEGDPERCARNDKTKHATWRNVLCDTWERLAKRLLR